MKGKRLLKMALRIVVGNRRGLLGFIVLFTFISIGLLAPLITPYDPNAGDLAKAYLPPFWLKGGDGAHPLGTDSLGRDVLSRLLYSFNIDLSIAALATAGAAAIGIPAGIMAGYFGGKVNRVVSILTDTWLSLPHSIFAIALITALGVKWVNIVIAITVIDWTRFARVIRGEVFGVREREFVKAAEILGLSASSIIKNEVLPNILPTITVLVTLELGIAVSVEALMSFVGLGVEAGIPSWGSMIAEGLGYVRTCWWPVTFPVLCIITIILGLNALGDGLREVLDPRTSSALR